MGILIRTNVATTLEEIADSKGRSQATLRVSFEGETTDARFTSCVTLQLSLSGVVTLQTMPWIQNTYRASDLAGCGTNRVMLQRLTD